MVTSVAAGYRFDSCVAHLELTPFGRSPMMQRARGASWALDFPNPDPNSLSKTAAYSGGFSRLPTTPGSEFSARADILCAHRDSERDSGR